MTSSRYPMFQSAPRPHDLSTIVLETFRSKSKIKIKMFILLHRPNLQAHEMLNSTVLHQKNDQETPLANSVIIYLNETKFQKSTRKIISVFDRSLNQFIDQI